MSRKYTKSHYIKQMRHICKNESERWNESGKEYQDENGLGVSAGYRYAIKIVKAGGVNE